MYKTSLPPPESWFYILKDPTISLLPDSPAGENDNLREARSPETFFSMLQHLKRRVPRGPRNLKVIPNPSAKATVKEEVSPVLIMMDYTELAVICL